MSIDIPEGRLLVTWLDDPATLTRKVHIDRADPVIWIHDEFLAEILRTWEREKIDDNNFRFVSPLGEYLFRSHRNEQGIIMVDSPVLRLDADNRSVTYRLDEYDHQRNCWLARWPD